MTTTTKKALRFAAARAALAGALLATIGTARAADAADQAKAPPRESPPPSYQDPALPVE